jgi:hypothetical protein
MQARGRCSAQYRCSILCLGCSMKLVLAAVACQQLIASAVVIWRAGRVSCHDGTNAVNTQVDSPYQLPFNSFALYAA